MQQPRPFNGFYLQTACKLDAACPGYLNRILHASSLKRSVQFAAYPEIDFSQPEMMATRLRSLAPSVCDSSLDPVCPDRPCADPAAASHHPEGPLRQRTRWTAWPDVPHRL